MNIQKIQKEKYPFLLRQITQLTPEMDIIGTLPTDDHAFLCVVGSRSYSNYGKDSCRKLILGLRGYPIVIVSGMAIGMDSFAHEAALEAGLTTISFPGSGLDPSVLYPSSSRQLAKRIIAAGGALISRFPSLQLATDWTFPSRNRLMAGISHATLIIEARRGSGTLITAKYAEEFNRDVLAVPGPIDSELSYGPHMLIRRGATPITSSQDILEALGFTETSRYDDDDARALRLYGSLPKEKKLRPRKIDLDTKNRQTDTLDLNNENTLSKRVSSIQLQRQPTIDLDQFVLSPDERSICNLIMNESLSATDIIDQTSLPVSLFNITISGLEMKGLIRENDGKFRIKV